MFRSAVSIIAIVLASGPAYSQEPTLGETEGGEPDVVVEGFPDFIAARFENQGSEASSAAEQGWLNVGRRWEPGSRLRVCFMGGPPAVRRRIASVAAEWNAVGANIALDFGQMSNPRLCDQQQSDIRVGYSMPGYWSYVGKDSHYYAPQHEQSLNLSRFDYNPPASEQEFRRLVLHEFGHALGFNHEHQSPASGCDEEFDWPTVYSYLGRHPNYWTTQTIDHNMKPGRYFSGDTTTSFDLKSIMLYSFPAGFYKRGESSRCFAGTNVDLSEGDRLAARSAYASTQNAVLDRETALGRLWRAAGTAEGSQAMRDRIEFYAVPTAEFRAIPNALADNAASEVIGRPELLSVRSSALSEILTASAGRGE